MESERAGAQASRWIPSGRKKQYLLKPFPGYYLGPMNRREILIKLRENKAALRARGISHVALFGSRARDDARPDSDIDIMAV